MGPSIPDVGLCGLVDGAVGMWILCDDSCTRVLCCQNELFEDLV